MSIKKILLIIITLWLFLFNYDFSIAWIVNITDPSWTLEWASIAENWWDIIENIEDSWITILKGIKMILSWVLLIYIVYIWATMIMSMWDNEEDLSSSKRQIRYALAWLIFINIPWTIYDALNTSWWWAWWSTSKTWFLGSGVSWVFVNSNFETIIYDIVWFIEVIIFILAVFMFVLAWIQMISSGGKEDTVKEWKNKLLYWAIWLIFVWIIETWKHISFTGDIDGTFSLFWILFNIWLFFVWATVSFFLVLATYYAVTSAWDEEKMKKAKSIVINTLIGMVLLLACYTFLVDLLSL